MTKREYFRQCVLRNVSFQEDFIRFCQKYPLVYRVTSQPGFRRLQALYATWNSCPETLRQPLAPAAYVIIPPFENFVNHLLHARRIPDLHKIGPGVEVVHPLDAQPDLGIPGRDPLGLTDFLRDAGDMMIKWPHYRGWKYPGALILSELFGRPRFVRGSDIARLGFDSAGRLMIGLARIWIPIYPDTHPHDLEWNRIQRLKTELYGRDRRVHLPRLASRLKIYDLMAAGRRVTDVAAVFKRRPSTILRTYLAVATDINDVAGAGDRQEHGANASSFDIQRHLDTCTKCRLSARQGDSAYCRVLRRYLIALEKA